jgi:TetR/AcrR family transcriptional regulator, transcriptional repressor for nem operon
MPDDLRDLEEAASKASPPPSTYQAEPVHAVLTDGAQDGSVAPGHADRATARAVVAQIDGAVR